MVAANIAVLWGAGAWEKMLAVRAVDIADFPDRARLLQYLLAAASFAGTGEQMTAYVVAGRTWGVPATDMAKAILSGQELCLALRRIVDGAADVARKHVLASLSLFVNDAGSTSLPDLRLAELRQRARPEKPIDHLAQLPDTTGPTVVANDLIGAVMDLFPVNNADGYGGFPFVEKDGTFICAYYDDKRRMTLASRNADDTWDMVRLDQMVDWDSHNYIALEVDGDGILHLCGNMHVTPLVYYRSTNPWDIKSMTRIGEMTGDKEDRVTYPKFFFMADGRMCFSYRDGQSGNGNILINIYDPRACQWSRMTQEPLLDGQDLRNAYVYGPVLGPDGYFHVCWVWRGTIHAETSHSLAYAKSPDLIDWYDGIGEPLHVPITYPRGDVVDNVPMGAGLINNNNLIGFDSTNRPIIAYHKFDENGFTQIYLARRDVVGWTQRQVTAWTYRWQFSGGGSLAFEITLLPPYSLGNGLIAQEFDHRVYGRGTLIVDEADLRPVAYRTGSLMVPDSLPMQTDDGLKRNIGFRWADMAGHSDFHILTWRSHQENHDKASDNVPIAGNGLDLLTVRRSDVAMQHLTNPVSKQTTAHPDQTLRRELHQSQIQLRDLRFRLQAEINHRKEIERRFLRMKISD